MPQAASQSSYVEKFHLSKVDTNLVYCGTSNGFTIIDKNCLGLVSSNEITDLGVKVTVYPNPSSKDIYMLRLTKVSILKKWFYIAYLEK